MRRIILSSALVVLTILGILVFFGARAMQGEMDALNSDGDAFLAAHPDSGATAGEVFAVSAGPATAPATFFLIHGSPGEWRNFGGYLASPILTEEFRVVVPDRPGYGHSAAAPPALSLAEQAASLVPWAESTPGKRIWLGHSFGASIVARLAMDRPDLVDGLILVSGAMDPQWEKPRWYHAVAGSPLGQRALPRDLLQANKECYAFYDDLLAMEKLWGNIRCPVFIIHARDDSLADFRHVAFAREHLANARVEMFDLPDGDHFLPWNRREVILGALLRMEREIVPQDGEDRPHRLLTPD